MKFACLGYYDEKQWAAIPGSQQQALIAECIAFDKELNAGGHFAGGIALQGGDATTRLRWKDGRASQTDGPFAETKELLGGILILEAKDRDEAIALMKRHPGLRLGPFEIRAVDEEFMSQHPLLKDR